MFPHDDDDDEFELLRELVEFVANAVRGMFVPPATTAESVARGTAIPTLLFPAVLVLMAWLIGFSLWMSAVLAFGGLAWLCYLGWVATTLERSYQRHLREEEEDPDIKLTDFKRRRYQ